MRVPLLPLDLVLKYESIILAETSSEKIITFRKMVCLAQLNYSRVCNGKCWAVLTRCVSVSNTYNKLDVSKMLSLVLLLLH